MKKRLLAAFLAMAMTAAMVTGCSTPGSGGGDGGSGSDSDGGSSGGGGKKRITYTLREDVPSMDPQNSNSIKRLSVQRLPTSMCLPA